MKRKKYFFWCKIFQANTFLKLPLQLEKALNRNVYIFLQQKPNFALLTLATNAILKAQALLPFIMLPIVRRSCKKLQMLSTVCKFKRIRTIFSWKCVSSKTGQKVTAARYSNLLDRRLATASYNNYLGEPILCHQTTSNQNSPLYPCAVPYTNQQNIQYCRHLAYFKRDMIFGK